MSDGGKGSKQRPTNHEAYASSWDKIFGEKGATSSDTQGAPTVAAAMPMQSTPTEATALPVTAYQISADLINRLRNT